MFLDHTQRHTTVGRTPLDEWSACHRDLYLTTHDTYNRQTSMPSVGFEPTISVDERPQTYPLDRAVTETDILLFQPTVTNVLLKTCTASDSIWHSVIVFTTPRLWTYHNPCECSPYPSVHFRLRIQNRQFNKSIGITISQCPIRSLLKAHKLFTPFRLYLQDERTIYNCPCSNKSPIRCNSFFCLLSWHLFTAQHVSGVLTPIIRSSTTAAAAFGFTFRAWR